MCYALFSSSVNILLSFWFHSVCFSSFLFVSFSLPSRFLSVHLYVCHLLPLFHHLSFVICFLGVCHRLCIVYLFFYPNILLLLFVLPLTCSLACYVSSVFYSFWVVFYNLIWIFDLAAVERISFVHLFFAWMLFVLSFNAYLLLSVFSSLSSVVSYPTFVCLPVSLSSARHLSLDFPHLLTDIFCLPFIFRLSSIASFFFWYLTSVL